VQMKHVHMKRIWVDDDNHFLKGYPVNELEVVEDKWYVVLWHRVVSLFKKNS